MPKRQTKAQRHRVKDHLHVRSPSFRQVPVDDLMSDEGENLIRVAFGSDSPEDPPRGYRSVVAVEGELVLNEEMARALVDMLSDWLKERKKAR